MKRVIIESPYRGWGPSEVEANVRYAGQCLEDSLKRGEAPIASHLLYPGVLDDDDAEQRKVGMEAGWAWIEVAELLVVYTDRGVSQGMKGAIGKAGKYSVEVEYRTIPGYSSSPQREASSDDAGAICP